MTTQTNRTEFRVTQTQKLIAAKALESVTEEEVQLDDPRIDVFVRTMVVIQNGQMGGYGARGTYKSFASRLHREPVQVAQERFDLETKVDEFHRKVDSAQGEAARRIRENRARLLRAEIRSLESLENEPNEEIGYNVHEQLALLRRELFELRLGRVIRPVRL